MPSKPYRIQKPGRFFDPAKHKAKKPPRTHCYRCGVPLEGSTDITDDHIPPKGFFPTPLPDNLITVRSCTTCNNGKSQNEELFRLVITCSLDQTPEAARLYNESTLPGTLAERRLVPQISSMLSTSKPALLTRHGIMSPAYNLKLPTDPLRRVAEEIARGMTAHQYPEMLTHELQFRVYFIKSMRDFLAVYFEIHPSWLTIARGNGSFVAHHAAAEDVGNKVGLWLMSFHERITVLVNYWDKDHPEFERHRKR